MLKFGQTFAENLSFPAVIELVGDVGAGKTTFTRGLAMGLGIKEAVTSPSFTISKRYSFSLNQECCKKYNISLNSQPVGELIHYDFYRLGDPGIMRDELADALSLPCAVIVVEWGESITDLLPPSKYRIEFNYLDEQARELTITQNSQNVENLWKNCGKGIKSCVKPVNNSNNYSAKLEENL